MNDQSQKTSLAKALIIAFVFIYLFSILRYTINTPYWDDYDAVLGFLNHLKESNLIDGLRLFFYQHNEHRLVFNRIIEVIQLKAFGEVNFLYLTLIGNIGWLLVIYLIWRYTTKQGLTLLEFTPIVVLLLSFSHNELMSWAMASIQQYYQILFSLLAIWFLVKKSNALALFWMTVSIFTGSGGLVLIPLFFLHAITKKEGRNLFIFLLASIFLLALFFIVLDYKSPGGHPSIIEALKNPTSLVFYFFTFLGSSFRSKELALVAGVILSLLFFLRAKKAFNDIPFVFWSVIFVLGTAMATSLARSGFGLEQALSSRYTEYSLLLIALVYIQHLLIHEQAKRKKIFKYFFAFAMIAFIYWFIKGSSSMNQRYETLRYNGIAYPDRENAEMQLKKSYYNGYFYTWKDSSLPSKLFNAKETNLTNEYCLTVNNDLKFCKGDEEIHPTDKILTIPSHQKTISINGWTVDNYNQKSACGVYVILGDKKSSFLLEKRKDIAKHFNNQKYLMSGFNASIDISSLPDGAYSLMLRTVSSGCDSYYDTFEINIIKGAASDNAAST